MSPFLLHSGIIPYQLRIPPSRFLYQQTHRISWNQLGTPVYSNPRWWTNLHLRLPQSYAFNSCPKAASIERYCWWFWNPVNQLSLVVYPMILQLRLVVELGRFIPWFTGFLYILYIQFRWLGLPWGISEPSTEIRGATKRWTARELAIHPASRWAGLG